MLQVETPKNTEQFPQLIKPRAIKIGKNFAFKFFLLSTPTDKKWYVMLNMQIMKNRESSNAPKNMEIFGIKPDAMWLVLKQTFTTTSITTRSSCDSNPSRATRPIYSFSTFGFFVCFSRLFSFTHS